ncbi:MAG: hypothetical protein ACPGWS_08045 [Solirubrobacterales bacterium]
MASRYQATRNSDGTFDILNVPIFGELPKNARGNDEDIGRAWMRKAIAKAQLREGEGYLPPLHIHHHSFERGKPAGHFKVTRVGKTTYEGEKIDVLFADLVKVHADVFELIRGGKLPYRSVEIHNFAEPEIDSLALLDSEVPFFRFELLTGERIDLKEGDSPSVHSLAKTPGPMCAVMTRDGGAFALAAFSDTNEQDAQPDRFRWELDENGEPRITFEAPKSPEDEDGKHTNDGDDDIDAAILDCEKQLKKLLAKKKAKASAKAASDPAPSDRPVEPGGGKEGKVMSDTIDPKVAARLDAAEATAEAAKAETAKLRAEKTAELRAADATAQLKGCAINDKIRGRIAKFAALDDESVLDDYVEDLKEIAPKDPPKTFEAWAGGEEIPEDIAAFEAEGPEALEAALKYGHEYERFAAHFSGTREEYIRSRLKQVQEDAAPAASGA